MDAKNANYVDYSKCISNGQVVDSIYLKQNTHNRVVKAIETETQTIVRKLSKWT